MGTYLYQVVTINGKIIAFEADEVDSENDRHIFLFGGEVVAEFERRNIAGYFATEILEDEDGEDYD